MSRERLCEYSRSVCEAANVENRYLHDLRGKFVSRMAESGMHLVCDSLGNAPGDDDLDVLRSRTDSPDDVDEQLRRHRKALKLVVNR